MNKRTLTTGIVACALGLVAVGVGLDEGRTTPAAAATPRPTPIATPVPAATPTPTPVAVPTPTPVAVPTPTPAPTAALKPLPEVGTDRIQIALLLDTSSSMDGLINQARTQLWKVVNEYGRATRGGKRARLEIALYEYGHSSLSEESGYVRQILPFTGDLDRVSEELFALHTNGGEEYCGTVIQKATRDLAWSKAAHDLRLVFIAGNEAFDQGPVDFHKSIAAARAKGIQVNTIHCGGDDPSWREGALVAKGQYLQIDQDQVVAYIAAPQDDEITRLGVELNGTYLAFGSTGRASYARQAAQDQNAWTNQGSMVARSLSKANGNYDNSGWDLVDATRNGTDLAKLPTEALPEEMRGLDAAGRKAFVARKTAERQRLQARINTLSAEREKFVAAERAKQGGDAQSTLDAAMVKVARDQATLAGYRFE